MSEKGELDKKEEDDNKTSVEDVLVFFVYIDSSAYFENNALIKLTAKALSPP